MARLIDSIQGHEQVWSSLTSARTLPHAMAFTGPAGIGKQKVAWALAQFLVCTSGTETHPCGLCGACLRVEKQQSESVLAVNADGPQIKIESSHQILEFLSLARMSPARIVIVNDAHLLNPQAANALLKVVEEPPPSTYFTMVVPEISQLLPTLRSRSQTIRFSPLNESILGQGEDIDAWMLKSSRGSFEKLAEFRDNETNELRQTVFAFLKGSFERNRAGLVRLLESTKDRASAQQAVRFLQQGLRDWTVLDAGSLIHGDFEETWRALPALPSHRKTELWRSAQQMESDLLGNADRTLVFENFYYRSQHALD